MSAPANPFVFPQALVCGSLSKAEGGMTLRDHFAGQALAGLMAKDPWGSPSTHSSLAYTVADAMLAERGPVVTEPSSGNPYLGPIEPGMGFIWQPTLPYAREACVVAEVRPGSDDAPGREAMVRSVSQTAIGSPGQEADRSGSPAVRPDPTGTWNDEAHFRASVVRCPVLDEVAK